MSDQWYVADNQNNAPMGPYSESHLRDMIVEGRFPPACLIWREGMGQWAPANQTLADLQLPAYLQQQQPVAATPSPTHQPEHQPSQQPEQQPAQAQPQRENHTQPQPQTQAPATGGMSSQLAALVQNTVQKAEGAGASISQQMPAAANQTNHANQANQPANPYAASNAAGVASYWGANQTAPEQPDTSYIDPYQAPKSPAFTHDGYAYRSADGLFKTVQKYMIGALITIGIVAIVRLLLFSIVPNMRHPPMGHQEAYKFLGGLLMASTFAWLIFLCCFTVTFLVLVQRFNKNLRALGVKGLTYTPLWSVLWWFIPVMNLYHSFRIVLELYQASDAQPSQQPMGFGGPEKPKSRGSELPLFHGWWSGAVISFAINFIAPFFSYHSNSRVVAERLSIANVFATTFSITSGICLIMFVGAIKKRLDRMAASRS